MTWTNEQLLAIQTMRYSYLLARREGRRTHIVVDGGIFPPEISSQEILKAIGVEPNEDITYTYSVYSGKK